MIDTEHTTIKENSDIIETAEILENKQNGSEETLDKLSERKMI